ncbi:MAG: tetratricopeptide repeat protein [Tannerella sp.]|jgi:tetratricopeptide (TPR) repeat protein|nr:tetratricopeptide repeat protein [Tannerella sp.]
MKQMNRIIIGISIGLFCSGIVFGQKAERERIREGNKLYNSEKFTESEIAYRKGIEVNPRSFEGAYDLGNALYKQQKYPEAAEQYQLVASQGERLLTENPANINRMAQVFHNIGNIGMQNKEYAKSIEAYKQSLRFNPTDDETRYNLALAQKLLENQEQNQDQQQEQQDQQQEQQQNDQNQEQQPPNQNEDQQQQQEQPQNENMSRENAQQILDAFLQDEKETQDKVKQAQERQRERRRTERQW